MTCDAVLLIAFGGPGNMDDVPRFLENVTRGRGIPPERLQEVVGHYELFGGRSPLTDVTLRQAAALRRELERAGPRVPVYVGMRNWHPFLEETLGRMADDGVRRAAGLILSAQQSEAGWQRYQADVHDAQQQLGDRAPAVDFGPGWHDHPLFIAAAADRTTAASSRLPADRRAAVHVVFTAHSLPVGPPNSAAYARQVTEGARLVAGRIGHDAWSVAYQSRSGPPSVPWLEPDVGAALVRLAGEGVRDVVVVPLGFVSDNIEILYDLDTEARQVAAENGLDMIRADAINDHPLFVRLLAELVRRTAACPS